MTSRDVVEKIQDLTHLRWDEKAATSGTGGTFLKSRRKTSRGNAYYKLSCYNSFDGIYGHESVNEVIASRILNKLRIPHVPYKLVHAKVLVNGAEHETWLSESHDYRKRGERRQPLDTFYDLNSDPEDDRLSFCKSYGWDIPIQRMMAFDYLIINRDRHGANIDVLFRDGGVCLAPLYDHGLSFICTAYNDIDKAKEFDPMRDIRVNNYLGSKDSLESNLSLLNKGILLATLAKSDKELLFARLDNALSSDHIDAIWEIIGMRWRHLVEMGIIDESQ